MGVYLDRETGWYRHRDDTPAILDKLDKILSALWPAPSSAPHPLAQQLRDIANDGILTDSRCEVLRRAADEIDRHG